MDGGSQPQPVRRSNRLGKAEKGAAANPSSNGVGGVGGGDGWPAVLGPKPALPDARMGTHPCGRLCRGALPLHGRWRAARRGAPPCDPANDPAGTTAAAVPAAATAATAAPPPRLRTMATTSSGARQQQQMRTSREGARPTEGESDAATVCGDRSGEGSLGGVFSDMLEIVEAGCCPSPPLPPPPSSSRHVNVGRGASSRLSGCYQW
jgi:hypothetical protein